MSEESAPYRIRSLGTRAANCLDAAGLLDPAHVAAAYRSGTLKKLPNLGRTTLREIAVWLAEQGLIGGDETPPRSTYHTTRPATLKHEEAVQLLREALQLMKRAQTNVNGGRWECGAVYSRLMKVTQDYVNPSLVDQEGAKRAAHIRATSRGINAPIKPLAE